MRRIPLHALLLLSLGGCFLYDPSFQTPAADGRPENAIVTVRFEGNRALSAHTLRRPIADYLYDLSQRPDNDAALFDAAAELEEIYNGYGYPDAVVRYRRGETVREEDRIARLQAVFEIAEGPLVLVGDPEFTGNDHATVDELRGLWSRQLSGVLGLGDALYVAGEIELLVIDVETYYRERGFLDVLVQPPVVNRTGDRVTVLIEVDEGPYVEFGTVSLAPELQSAVGPDPPPPPDGGYSRRKVQEYELAVRTRLRRRGFPLPEVTTRVERDPDQPCIHLSVDGKPGRHATIAEIVVRNNEQTATNVIRGRFRARVGDQYDGKLEDDGLRRLYLTGLFRRVRIDHEWIGDDRLRIVIDVEEDETKSIEFLAGYGSYERLRGGVRFEERNLFGSGKRLSVLGHASQKGYRTETTITDPDFLETDTSFSVGGEYFRREEPSFTDEAYGTTVSLQRPLLEGLTAHVGYTYRDRVDASTVVSSPNNTLVDFTEGRVFAELNNDHRDNPLFPRSGHEEFVLFDVIDPALGADVEFHRLRAGATAHVPLLGDLRLVLRSEQGWLWPGESSQEVPLQERFFNGGDATVRSFRESQLGPLDVNGAPVGGEYRNVFSVELRVAMWQTLEGSLFADAGNVGTSVSEFGFGDMRYGIGGGLRLVLPIGPVRVDAGYNPDQNPGEKEWVVHFSVGYPF